MSSQDKWSPLRPPRLPMPLVVEDSPSRGLKAAPGEETPFSYHQDASNYQVDFSPDHYTQRSRVSTYSPTVSRPPATHARARAPSDDRNRHGIPPPYERRRRISFVREPNTEAPISEKQELEPSHFYRNEKNYGMLSRIIDLCDEKHHDEDEDPAKHNDNEYEKGSMSQIGAALSHRGTAPSGASYTSMGLQVLDEDDPCITGKRVTQLGDNFDDAALSSLRHLSYKERRKERNRMMIVFNITSLMNRHKFVLVLAKGLMIFGAPSHRIVSQLVAASNILEVNANFIYIPGTIICNFSDPDTKTTESHFVKCASGLNLGSLHALHAIYRRVMHDELSARKATEMIEELIIGQEKHSILKSCVLSFCLSALICPLAFSGSFLDMWIAGTCAAAISYLRSRAAKNNKVYDNVFEITTCLIISFIVRGLSSITGDTLCYSAINSAAIISLLPGFLILSSSLELGSKEIISGSVKMVYALIYTIFLGFALTTGAELYFSTNHQARQSAMIAINQLTGITLQGTFNMLNSTLSGAVDTIPSSGTFYFNTLTTSTAKDFVGSCYRPADLPWYLQAFPFWTQFLIVPVFSILSSIANHAPVRSKQLVVMTVISCVAYATNELANHYILNRTGIVSAVGAFTVGVLGNLYSRKMGGTAFTSMVTGVLFLVPSGLSQAGGITANGAGLSMESAMISTTIGITVGLFMSQALVYAFGRRKNAASFSF